MQAADVLEVVSQVVCARALEGLGLLPRVPIAPRDFADPDVREGWIRDKHMQVLSFFDPQHPAREVDVFVAYPLDFDMLLAGAVPTRVGDRTMPVAARHHLIEMSKLPVGPVTSTTSRPSSDSSNGTPAVSNDPWSRATFAGTEQAQADLIADLTPDERLALLERLLDIAEASGALRRAREDKQRGLDAAWYAT